MPSSQGEAQKKSLSNIQNLIIVPGHALLKDEALAKQDLTYYSDENHWVLESFQKGEVKYYIQHVQAGLKLLMKDDESILIFSGGRTRPGHKKWSEAKSYLAVAQALPEWDKAFSDRMMTEDFARDSIQNICFPLFLYHQQFDIFPEHLTVVNWKFKADRFELHRQTLGFPAKEFTYFGVNNPLKKNLDGALKGEAKTLQQFTDNPFGLSEELKQKRAARDPHNDRYPYGKILKRFFKGTAYYQSHRDKFPQLGND